MTYNKLIEKRIEIQKEVKIVESLLIENIESVKIGDYLSISKRDVTKPSNLFFENPAKTFKVVHTIARYAFPDNNIIRKFLKYMPLFTKGINLLIRK